MDIRVKHPHKLLPKLFQPRGKPFVGRYRLKKPDCRVVVDPHLLKRLIRSLWEIGAIAFQLFQQK
jgi:hypothetical protein